jgi:hypothetical protein
LFSSYIIRTTVRSVAGSYGFGCRWVKLSMMAAFAQAASFRSASIVGASDVSIRTARMLGLTKLSGGPAAGDGGRASAEGGVAGAGEGAADEALFAQKQTSATAGAAAPIPVLLLRTPPPQVVIGVMGLV